MKPSKSLFPAMLAAHVENDDARSRSTLVTSNDGRAHRQKQRCDLAEASSESAMPAKEKRESYTGGKAGAGVYQTLINLMPPHSIYVEPFLGDGAVMRAKRPAQKSVGIDLDPDALARWRGDEVPNLELHETNALRWLQLMKLPDDALVYADPPYLMSTRRAHRHYYRCELSTDDEHSQLLDILEQLPCMVMVSGYFSKLYAVRLARWRRVDFFTTTRGGGRAQESVWINFPPPLELHDYRFLGDTFRERQRIKRKRERWKAKLLRMPELERHAILSAVQELRSTTSPQVAMTPASSSEIASGAGKSHICSIAGDDEGGS